MGVLQGRMQKMREKAVMIHERELTVEGILI